MAFCTSYTLKKLITTLHKMHNEKLFAGKLDHWYHWYLSKHGISHYAINSLLYLTTMREKYVKMYESFISKLQMYAKVMSSFKGLFVHFSFTTIIFAQNSR